MPINSRDKRFSLMLYDSLIGRVFPLPDAVISTADRIQWIGKYRGIAFTVVSAVVAADSFIPVIRRRRR